MSTSKTKHYSIYGERKPLPQGETWGPSRTLQSFKDETDINLIMEKYQSTGLLPTSTKQPRYGDFSDVTDYQSSLHAVMNAQEAFFDLPSKLRARFKNDPAELLSFLEDPSNREEAQSLGLIESPTINPLKASESSSETQSVKAEEKAKKPSAS